MADLLQRGAMFLEDQRHRHMTRPVVYQRGAESVEAQATVGRTVFEQTDQFGIVHRTESRDYLIRAADLVLAGERTLPKVGDRVRETLEDRALIYEVMAPGTASGGGGGGEPPFRFSDPERITLRVHTKFIGMEQAP
jgi:hypothetical protein